MKQYLIIIFVLVFLGGCKKNEVVAPNLSVIATSTVSKGSVATDTHKVNDTVVFVFQGNPDNIVFYSGEQGKNYDYKARITSTITATSPKFSFTSLRANSSQANSLGLFVSTDFKGVYDSTNVVNAIWTDITNRAVLSTGTSTASGTISLSDFASNNKPVYLAFKYNGIKSSTTPQPKWTITGTSITNQSLPDSTNSIILDMTNGGWFGVNTMNNAAVWATSNTQLVMDGGGINADDNIDWVISRKIDLATVKPDVGVGLKNLSTQLLSYNYRFTKAGTFKVTFLATNERVDAKKETVVSLNIVIVP